MKRITGNNKKYMIIAVSVLIAEFTARNNGGAARQVSNPQSATTYIPDSNMHRFKRRQLRQLTRQDNGI